MMLHQMGPLCDLVHTHQQHQCSCARAAPSPQITQDALFFYTQWPCCHGSARKHDAQHIKQHVTLSTAQHSAAHKLLCTPDTGPHLRPPGWRCCERGWPHGALSRLRPGRLWSCGLGRCAAAPRRWHLWRHGGGGGSACRLALYSVRHLPQPDSRIRHEVAETAAQHGSPGAYELHQCAYAPCSAAAEAGAACRQALLHMCNCHAHGKLSNHNIQALFCVSQSAARANSPQAQVRSPARGRAQRCC